CPVNAAERPWPDTASTIVGENSEGLQAERSIPVGVPESPRSYLSPFLQQRLHGLPVFHKARSRTPRCPTVCPQTCRELAQDSCKPRCRGSRQLPSCLRDGIPLVTPTRRSGRQDRWP